MFHLSFFFLIYIWFNPLSCLLLSHKILLHVHVLVYNFSSCISTQHHLFILSHLCGSFIYGSHLPSINVAYLLLWTLRFFINSTSVSNTFTRYIGSWIVICGNNAVIFIALLSVMLILIFPCILVHYLKKKTFLNNFWSFYVCCPIKC